MKRQAECERDAALTRVKELETENWVIYENTKGRISKAEAERDEARAQAHNDRCELLDDIKRVRAVLREVEWVVFVAYRHCPVCRRQEKYGHAPDCRLKAALEV